MNWLSRQALLWASVAVLALPAAVQAQKFTYTTNSDNTITITGYTGTGGVVNIPSTIDGKSVVTIGEIAFAHQRKLTGVTIPSSVTSIEYYAFDSCYNLNTVSLPIDGLQNIEDYAFSACLSLANIAIPYSVTNIGSSAFSTCANLSMITVNESNAVYSSTNGVLFDKYQTTVVQYPGGKAGSTYTIPNSVTTIGDESFADCHNLNTMIIPDSVTNIEHYAFGGCYNLTNITIGSGVTCIGETAFYQCTGLTSLSIPNSVTNIGGWAFCNSWNLTLMTIGNGVTHIGESAFQECESLTAIYFRGNAPIFDEPIFYDCYPIIYYLPGTTNWSTTFSGRPTVLWNPQVKKDGNFGVRPNCFGFTFTNAGSPTVAVEACTYRTNAIWVPMSANTLTGGSSYFGDSCWTNYPARFYRFTMP